jgi:(p)ppGpp synthase/HD superfamily hydrolase
VVANPPIRLGPRFAEALVWVSEVHAEQVRKVTGVPYVSHLLAVAALTLEDGGDEHDAVVALCHDAVEDQGGRATLDEIRRRFGDDVADAVDLLSDSYGEPKAPWPQRKRAVVARFARGDLPEGVLRVAAADKLHNARALLSQLRAEGDRTWAAFDASPGEVVWYYRAMADALAERLPGSTNVDQLRLVVADLEPWLDSGQVPVSA